MRRPSFLIGVFRIVLQWLNTTAPLDLGALKSRSFSQTYPRVPKSASPRGSSIRHSSPNPEHGRARSQPSLGDRFLTLTSRGALKAFRAARPSAARISRRTAVGGGARWVRTAHGSVGTANRESALANKLSPWALSLWGRICPCWHNPQS